jgi:serine/threonine-protein kinase
MNAPAGDDSGELIAGKYRVERVIGEGGMGTVLAARHELLDVRVAVKVLSAELTHQPGIIARFLREARAVARLKSEHVARVMDVGTLDEGQPFIVMELLEGEDLERRIGRAPLSVTEAATFILQTLEAMSQAHAIGIVHRDLKPANLFITTTPDGREIVKVLDFGIAKLTHAVKTEGGKSGGLTGEHATLGSPLYMAPEQVRAQPHIDGRADIWALGAIFYELVSGRLAFGGSSVGEIFGAVLHSSPAPLTEALPDAPEQLVAVIDRCLKKSADERYADVGELARAIVSLADPSWQGLVGRIEKTLARAGKGSDPEGSRVSRLGLEEEAAAAFGPEASSEARSRRRPIFSPTPMAPAVAMTPTTGVPKFPEIMNTADALPTGSNATPAPVTSTVLAGRHRGAVVAIPAIIGVLVVGFAATLLLKAPAPTPVQTPNAATVSSAVPAPVEELPNANVHVAETPAATAAPSASAAAPQAPATLVAPQAPQPAAAAQAGHKHVLVAHPPAAATARPGELPGVLRSAD